MPTMNISIPDTLRAFVEQEMNEGGYMSASEYFRERVRDRQHRRAQEKLDNLIREGVQSGPGIEATPQYWTHLKADFLAERETKKPIDSTDRRF